MTYSHVPRHERARRVAKTVPKFRYRLLSDATGMPTPYIVVICTRCGNEFGVDGRKWRDYSDQPTRPCPFCFKVSRIHKLTKED